MIPHVLLTVSAIGTLIGFFSQYSWWFDLASHFRAQYAAIQLLCVVLCLFLRKKRVLAITLCFLILNLLQIAPLYTFSDEEMGTQAGKRIKILFINVYTSNTWYSKVTEYIAQVDPDILALEEINPQWFEQLSGELKNFPHQKFLLRGDNFGIGLFSKISPTRMDIQYYGQVGVPSVLAQFLIHKNPVDLLFTHPVPPASQEYFHLRNDQLDAIASKRSEFQDNLIVIGDLNTTSWSYYFKDFLKRMNLRDSREGLGIQATWPAIFPILGITIDHCLVSSNIAVINRSVGPDIGSDHRPVEVELGLP